jgi:putative hydrolase of the HAD superfamily
MMRDLPVLTFDADDTLWHNESFFALTEEAFTQLLAPYTDPAALRERLIQTERRNLGVFG